MNAADDYAAAKAMLTRPLPAYVAYTVRSHLKFDAIVRDKTDDIVVRTADGAIVKGSLPEPPMVYVSGGGGRRTGGMEPVMQPAFKPACYTATGARMQQYEGRTLEAIALRSLCGSGSAERDFEVLYVDPRTRQPVAALGDDGDEHVAVHLAQQFTRYDGRTMPSSLYVRVHGTGLMFWLDLLVDQRYENYRFSNSEP